jgi:hypothetical protein
MRLRLLFIASLLTLFPWMAHAHVGSPDVFFSGPVGPYPVDITIRMPAVVPGRAQIIVRSKSADPIEVAFLPIFSRTAVKNAPPADTGTLVPGESNLYSGDLWLMSFGAYSIEVRINGKAGSGSIQIPVNSVATSQLPMPPYLEKLLLLLGAMLVIGGLAIVEAAARESVLPAGVAPVPRDRRRGLFACAVTAIIVALALAGGSRWWDSEASKFRRNLHSGGWPDLAANVSVQGSQRILHLTIGQKAFAANDSVPLLLDHGKLLHFFLVGDPARDAFAHIHPIRTGPKTFDVALPPLPAGRYEGFCDMTLGQGLSSTGTLSIQLPAIPTSSPAPAPMVVDPDDSWTISPAAAQHLTPAGDTLFQFPGGLQVAWKAHPPSRVSQDASLHFEVRDSTGHPVPLDPYMGMISHVAVLRSDGAVFAHLHPSGNYSMAAQMFFAKKVATETGAPAADGMDSMPGMDQPAPGDSSISIPYEFPSPGNYRIWVQFKTAGKIMTAVFDASVSA